MRTDIAILYATMTGNARECAEKTATTLRNAGFAARVHDLAGYDPRDLLEESTVLLAISTWGTESHRMMGSFFLIMSKTLAKPPFTNCALRSSRLATQAMTTSVSAAGIWTECSRNVGRADCLHEWIMTSISRRRSVPGVKRS